MINMLFDSSNSFYRRKKKKEKSAGKHFIFRNNALVLFKCKCYVNFQPLMLAEGHLFGVCVFVLIVSITTMSCEAETERLLNEKEIHS